eukprot:Selendium_serpulae@DN2928_c1_g1_i3.p1
MIGAEPILLAASRALQPGTWKAAWRGLAGKQISDVSKSLMRFGDRHIGSVAYLHNRGGHRAMWWANPLGYGFVTYLAYKTYHMGWIIPKQKRTAQLVAAAYGQGGQNLNPVPK